MDRALNYLGLARRGGNLQVGDELVRATIRAGHARLVVLASDVGSHTLRRADQLSESWNAPTVVGPWTKLELGQALGARSCALAAFTEPRIALAFLQAMDPPPDASVLEKVQTLATRATRHQAEQRAHENNQKRSPAVQRKRTK